MKYDALTDYLGVKNQQRLTLSFREIEAVLGFSLPPSAYKYRAWWANGGHTHADAWSNAGYCVDVVDFVNKTTSFVRDHAAPVKNSVAQKPITSSEAMTVCGFPFRFLQEIRPVCDSAGKVMEYYPQQALPGNADLNAFGSGAFCRFTIRAGNWPGVYLWVLDGEIVYIGETMNLQRRFNTGYGMIEPVNCCVGGQTTNCKMNKVVLNLARKGKYIKLYFYGTEAYKQVELELLGKVKTRYNVKDN